MGFTSDCSLVSSAWYSLGKKSGLMLIICPSFTKVGPKSSSTCRTFTGVTPCKSSLSLSTATISFSLRAEEISMLPSSACPKNSLSIAAATSLPVRMHLMGIHENT